MNYNHFTINYIEALQKHLKIEIVNDRALFFPDFIIEKDIINLRNELSEIWKESESSISILERSYDSKIQSGLFGLIDNFELALKTGYLLGDRVVVIDYIFERILNAKEINKINKITLGSLASSLVTALELAKKGRFVIIPSPFNWLPKSKKVIKEVSKKTILTPQLMSLLNILSITKRCRLQPFTLAESKDNYKSIIDNDIDFVAEIGKDSGGTAYNSILGGLLTERLLKDDELKIILNVPLSEYHTIIDSQNQFYTEYLSQITFGGSMKAENNLDIISEEIKEAIKNRNNNTIKKAAKTIGKIGGVGGGTIALIGSFTAVSAPLLAIAALMAFSPTLADLIPEKSSDKNSIITVFKELATQ